MFQFEALAKVGIDVLRAKAEEQIKTMLAPQIAEAQLFAVTQLKNIGITEVPGNIANSLLSGDTGVVLNWAKEEAPKLGLKLVSKELGFDLGPISGELTEAIAAASNKDFLTLARIGVRVSKTDPVLGQAITAAVEKQDFAAITKLAAKRMNIDPALVDAGIAAGKGNLEGLVGIGGKYAGLSPQQLSLLTGAYQTVDKGIRTGNFDIRPMVQIVSNTALKDKPEWKGVVTSAMNTFDSVSTLLKFGGQQAPSLPAFAAQRAEESQQIKNVISSIGGVLTAVAGVIAGVGVAAGNPFTAVAGAVIAALVLIASVIVQLAEGDVNDTKWLSEIDTIMRNAASKGFSMPPFQFDYPNIVLHRYIGPVFASGTQPIRLKEIWRNYLDRQVSLELLGQGNSSEFEKPEYQRTRERFRSQYDAIIAYGLKVKAIMEKAAEVEYDPKKLSANEMAAASAFTILTKSGKDSDGAPLSLGTPPFGPPTFESLLLISAAVGAEFNVPYTRLLDFAMNMVAVNRDGKKFLSIQEAARKGESFLQGQSPIFNGTCPVPCYWIPDEYVFDLKNVTVDRLDQKELWIRPDNDYLFATKKMRVWGNDTPVHVAWIDDRVVPSMDWDETERIDFAAAKKKREQFQKLFPNRIPAGIDAAPRVRQGLGRRNASDLQNCPGKGCWFDDDVKEELGKRGTAYSPIEKNTVKGWLAGSTEAVFIQRGTYTPTISAWGELIRQLRLQAQSTSGSVRGEEVGWNQRSFVVANLKAYQAQHPEADFASSVIAVLKDQKLEESLKLLGDIGVGPSSPDFIAHEVDLVLRKNPSLSFIEGVAAVTGSTSKPKFRNIEEWGAANPEAFAKLKAGNPQAYGMQAAGIAGSWAGWAAGFNGILNAAVGMDVVMQKDAIRKGLVTFNETPVPRTLKEALDKDAGLRNRYEAEIRRATDSWNNTAKAVESSMALNGVSGMGNKWKSANPLESFTNPVNVRFENEVGEKFAAYSARKATFQSAKSEVEGESATIPASTAIPLAAAAGLGLWWYLGRK